MLKKMNSAVFLSFLLILLLPATSYCGLIFQNFEPDNGTPVYGEGNGAAVGIATAYEADHYSSSQAWKIETANYWAGSSVYPQGNLAHLDAQPQRHDRLIFWMRAIPDSGWWIYGPKVSHNNVGVTFYDTANYQNGFEVWTTEKAVYNRWTRLEVLFSQLPADFDLAHLSRIAFKNYWPGKYFVDDIQIVSEDRFYQAFDDPFADEYGWKWNGN
ncbi:MAG TPA: hypothetical protein VLJ10_05505, partial [Candidatus Bathyarchaeia archaeon]|nr:hypothetical protein [Candidatus Bathyarchaeia archaeon]